MSVKRAGGTRVYSRAVMATPVRESGRWAGRPGRLGVAGLLAAGTLLLYAQVVRHGFLLYDDWTYVTDPHVRAGLSAGNVLWAFTTLTFSNWHPLTWLSYMLSSCSGSTRARCTS